jgi:hypothetical protein
MEKKMIYVIDTIADGRSIEVDIKLSPVDINYADIFITQDKGEEHEKIMHAQVKIEDLEVASKALLMERARIKK